MIDFSKIPVPDIVEALDFEGVFADIVADFRTRFPDFDALVESDPAIKLIEAFAYREVLLRARINNAARACMIASATGADLDNIAANFGVMRKPDENDSDLRKRTILAIEASATAGSRNAYIYHASSVE
ncbi:MAG: baseplate J/gp47 family protein, partial [Opitutales bacterium]|nr:baseplate J/gp47 family protein [Opitutales bacterium]